MCKGDAAVSEKLRSGWMYTAGPQRKASLFPEKKALLARGLTRGSSTPFASGNSCAPSLQISYIDLATFKAGEANFSVNKKLEGLSVGDALVFSFLSLTSLFVACSVVPLLSPFNLFSGLALFSRSVQRQQKVFVFAVHLQL